MFLAGSSLCVCLDAQSLHIDQVIPNNTFSQPNEDLQRGIGTPPSKANLTEGVNENTNLNSAESTTRSVDSHGNLVRRRSFCKAPGLRRSVRTKRFSYPTASQVAKQHTAKRTNKNTTTSDVSRVVKEDKSTVEEGGVILDDSAMIDTSSSKGGEGVMPRSKRLKSDEMTTICESKRDVSMMSSAVNHSQKDDVLFDMDTLSQFPMECICSPTSLNSLNGYITTSTVQQQVLSPESTEDLRKRSDTITREIDATIVCKTEDIKIHSDVVHSGEKAFKSNSLQGESDVIESPVSFVNCQNVPVLHSEWKTGFHTTGGKKLEISDKTLKCTHALLEELDLPAVSLTSHGLRPTADEEVDEDIFREGADLTKGAKTEITQPEMAQENQDGVSTAFQATVGQVIERYSPEIEGNINGVNEQEAAHKFITKTDNISDFDKQHSSVVAEFCGFLTANGKEVRIFESAMKEARKPLSEIDAELDNGDSGVTVNVTREEEPSYSISNKQGASGNGLREAYAEGSPCGTSQLKDMPQPDEINITASGMIGSAIKEEIEVTALQNPEQSVNELKCKESENVNDSLLEDLLNDCKRQRRDSLATIREGIEEHHGGILTNTDEVSDLTLRGSDCERSSEYQENTSTEYCSSTEPNPENSGVLFKTASGNPVSVSKAALSKAKSTWNKIDRELALEGAYRPQHKNVESLNSFHAVPAGDVDVLPRTLSIAKDSRRQTGEKMIEENNDILSDDVLNTLEGKVNKIDHDFVSEDQIKSWTHSASSCGPKTAIGETGELSEASFTTFSGFQTAKGRKVTLSEEALRQGRDIIRRITGDPSEGLQENIDCHSANGTHHSVSKDAEQSLRTGAQVMQSEKKPGSSTTKLKSFSGFQTAAGKSVTLSKEMLEKGAAIMQQIDKSLEQNKGTNISHSSSTSGFTGFHTANGQSVKLSRESLEKGAAIMQQIDRSLEQNKGTSISHSSSTSGFSGFQTAGGQSVKLSRESLDKGAAIMQQIDRSLEQNKGISISHSPSTSGFTGFQTAGGQHVKLSRESLDKGTAIIQQIDKSLEQNKGTSISHSPSTSAFSGFQTAGVQSVRLSRESLDKGAAIMQQIDRSLQESSAEHTRSTTGFSGFQTASGQSVKLSKESMKKGAAIMQQIDRSLEDKWDNTVSAPSVSGFQTASGQSVKLSKESMKKGAAIMQQIDKSLQEEKRNSASSKSFPETKPSSSSFSGFSGFQTAGGKKVEISESALAKAKETMAGIERELQVTNKDTTAISLDASRKAREQFGIMKQETGNYGGTFGGFVTAGGQRVSVSEQALTKAKAFLQEADSAFNDSKTKDAEASVRELVAAAEVPGRTMSPSGRGCFVEHDEAVSREVLESSEALLAYESVMDASDALGSLHNGNVAVWSSFDTSGGSFIAGREKGKYQIEMNDPIVHVMNAAS